MIPGLVCWGRQGAGLAEPPCTRAAIPRLVHLGAALAAQVVKNARDGLGMATHPSVLAWRIPWTEEPGGPQSTGSQRVGHNRAAHTACTCASLVCLEAWP